MSDQTLALYIIGLYLVPAVVAIIRGHQSAMAITFVDIALGWTLIGWLWAMVWSLAGVKRGE